MKNRSRSESAPSMKARIIYADYPSSVTGSAIQVACQTKTASQPYVMQFEVMHRTIGAIARCWSVEEATNKIKNDLLAAFG